MTNVRTRKPRILIQAPEIPLSLDKKHVGTRVQFSSSTDFTDSTSMIFDKTIYSPDDILNIQITKQDGSPLEISLDDVYYFRYQLIYDSVSHPTNNPDQYTKDTFSVISSIYGDQEGFRYDRIIITTPLLSVEEKNGNLGNNNLIITASGYKTIVGSGDHKYTTWIVETSDGEEIVRREKDADNLETFSLPMDLLKPGKLYVIKARFISSTNGESNFGKCLYNMAISKNDYVDVSPVGDLNYGNDLFFKVVTKMPNVTGISARLCSVVGNTEVDIPATINVTNGTIKISPFTDISGNYSLIPSISITNVFKLYVRPIVNSNTNVVWSDMITYTFMLSFPDVYPIDYSSNYPGQYSMLKDLNVGPTAMASRELKNGTIPLMISGTKQIRIYARYGNAIRPTNIVFDLPLDYDNVVIPYINFLELYNGEIVVNYVILGDNDYKLSGWAFYSVDYSTNSWTLLASKVLEDEHFGTSISSSASVTRDGKVIYIPDQYFTKSLDVNPSVIYYLGLPDTDPIEVKSSGSAIQLLQHGADNYTNTTFSFPLGLAEYSFSGDYIHVKNINTKDYLHLTAQTISDVNTNGSTQMVFQLPSEFSPDIVFTSGEMLLLDTGNFKVTIPYDDLTKKNLKLNVYNKVDSSNVKTSELKRGSDIRIVINHVEKSLYVNNDKISTVTGSYTSGDTYIGGEYGVQSQSQTEKYYEFFIKYVAFTRDVAEVPLTYVIRNEINYQDLPLMRISRNNSDVVREKIIATIKPGVKKHMTLSPLTTDPGNEKFIILGGTNNTTIDVDPSQPGIVKYALLNRDIGILSQVGSGWNIQWLESSNNRVNLPADLVPDDYYSLSAFRRYDGKILIFNNSLAGPGSEDTSSFVLDVTKITPTELQEGWFVKNKNDSRIDLPFRSTIQMRDGDYLRLSYQETLASGDLACKVLLYPHQPLTDYTDTDAPININKNLVVPVGKVMSIENAYLYDSITIEGDAPDNTGVLIWTDKQGTRTLDYSYKIITRDTTSTTAEVDALGKEKFIVLEGVDWRINNK